MILAIDFNGWMSILSRTHVHRPSLTIPKSLLAMESDVGFQAALEEARKGAAEGGIPIGAALVSADGKILGQGHNMRVQKNSATLHVRTDGRIPLICWLEMSTGRDLSVGERRTASCLSLQGFHYVHNSLPLRHVYRRLPSV